MSKIAGLMVAALLAAAAVTGCTQEGRVLDESEPGETLTTEVAYGDVPTVEVSGQRPAQLMPEVESFAPRSTYAGALVGSMNGVLAN